MNTPAVLLTLRAFFEFAIYDARRAWFRIRSLQDRLGDVSHVASRAPFCSPSLVLDAVNLAARFYFKPVLCLQRSIVTVRLLRHYGSACQLVIGYRPSPFLAHAWVEIDGQIMNDLPGYAEQLRVLGKL